MADANAWAKAFTGIGPRGIDLFDDPPPRESDDSLRARLLYVAGDGERAAHRILTASGVELDALAESYCLRRREL